MFCLHCKEFFFDINEVVETRTNKWFNDLCPFCWGTRCVNASVRVMHYDEPFRVITSEIKQCLLDNPSLMTYIVESWRELDHNV